MQYIVVDYGAVGDGRTKNTEAIQRAIADCHAGGGGQVVIPAGVFVSGTLELQDNVDLHLLQGAVLKGSPDREDYTDRYNAPYDQPCEAEVVANTHLLVAWKKENISITGRGTIDGNGPAFFGPPVESPIKEAVFDRTGRWRPGQMVALLECHAVRIEGVTLRNSTYWTIWPYCCEELLIDGIKIRNDWRTSNGDGIDCDGSRNVIISNCDIAAGDDGIALRANRVRSGLDRCDLEHVAITNCIIDTPMAGIRFGPSGEDSAMRNITVSNCVIKHADCGLLFSQAFIKGHWEKGVLVENVRISNIMIQGKSPLMMLATPHTTAPNGFRNIFISNITAETEGGCYLCGNGKSLFEGIHIRDFHFAPAKNQSGRCKGVLAENCFTAKQVKSLTIRDLTLDTSRLADENPGTVMAFDEIGALALDGVEILPVGEMELQEIGKLNTPGNGS